MKTNILFIGTCLMFVFTSCTINKRVHRPGYNMEWYSANPKSKTHPMMERSIRTEDLECISKNNDQIAINVETIPHEIENVELIDYSKYSITERSKIVQNSISEYTQTSSPQIVIDDSLEVNGNETMDSGEENTGALSRLSFGFGLTSYITLLVGFALAIGLVNVLAVIFLGVTFILSVLAVVFGLKALKKYRGIDKKQSKRGLAIAGIILGSLIILLGVVILFSNIY